jgi:transcription antitermination factor NusG
MQIFDLNDPIHWFALQVVPNHERKVADILTYKGRTSFLPTYKKKQRWSDRTKITEFPLFPGYVFCQLSHSVARDVLSTPGVNRIVGFGGKPYPIADEEIIALQKTLRSGLQPRPEPYLKIGRKVQIVEGPLAGITGILTGYMNQGRLVISVDMIMQSISVEIDVSVVVPVGAAPSSLCYQQIQSTGSSQFGQPRKTA